MQIIVDRLNGIIRTALQAYLAAERDLDIANESRDQAAITAAKEKVKLAGRQAVDLLHHFADFVFKEPASLPTTFADIGAVRAAIKPLCVFGRSGPPIDDVDLLREVADAFKHHRPDRRNATVSVSFAITTQYGGYGQLRFGEGKYGGAEQTIVTRTTGERRALSSILQNVFDAWMTYLGQPLPPISQY
ncbi:MULTISPECIES: hypothetical protein [unclassified Bradyrhizobium]|uniref:hypothetical protein n=1 Tax=unclassified Bradyrhizobium TaxID=2631580 RepID=UPI002916E1CC|nr:MULTISPECIES: hypothetical protein [unclassified Bradyrhizobium]